MPPPVRVLTVNQNRILREGICMLIAMEPGLELAGFAETPDAAPGLFAEKRPELTLVDIDFPGQTSLEAIQGILKLDPNAWIIGLVTHEWDGSGRRAVDAGASSVLAKDLIGERLVPLIRAGRRKAAGSRGV